MCTGGLTSAISSVDYRTEVQLSEPSTGTDGFPPMYGLPQVPGGGTPGLVGVVRMGVCKGKCTYTGSG